MEDDEDEIRVTLRIPKALHSEVLKFAQGNGRRPKSSLNAALVFLVRVGLAQQLKQAGELGKSEGKRTLRSVASQAAADRRVGVRRPDVR